MRLSVRALPLLAALLAAACGGDDSAGPDIFPVRRVVIRLPDGTAADTMERARAFGTIDFRLQAFDASGFQLTRDRYAERWSSSNVDVANVSGSGLTTVRGNGRTLLVASADGVADTVALVVEQEAVAVRAEQDTLVALAPGATVLGGGTPVSGPAQFTLVRVDANGEAAPSSQPVTVTNLDPGLIDVAYLAGDTVRVTGLAPGAARVGFAFGAFSDTLAVQVVSSYAVIGIFATPDGTVFSPSTVTIPLGAAVVFQNGEVSAAGAAGTGWRVGPIAGRGYEGQLFSEPGTYAFTAGLASGSVVVTP